MNLKKELFSHIEHLIKVNEKQSDDMLEMLITLTILLNENQSNRFRGASYHKKLTFDRLSIDIRFDKYATHD